MWVVPYVPILLQMCLEHYSIQTLSISIAAITCSKMLPTIHIITFFLHCFFVELISLLNELC